MDRKNDEGVSNATWIPFIWMFLAASRYVSGWLNLGTADISDISADAMGKGNPVNQAVFTALIIAGVLILCHRRINWKALFVENKWIWLYFVFGALSFCWSDYPLISFKRWIKALGNVVMALVVLTEERPYLATGVILRRLAYILLPLSVLFIKYYPHLGRAYHMGRPMFIGVSGTKNGLGVICLLSGIYFTWNLLLGRRGENALGQRFHYSIYLIVLPMIAWLFFMADSATSFVCMIVAAGLFVVARQPTVARKPRRIMFVCIVVISFYGIMEMGFDVKDTIFNMLGRRPDLTARVPMWNDLLSQVRNQIIGVGYESFWLGPRLQYMMEAWGIRTQAHNGYLEMYLNMGLIGVFFVFSWIVSGLRKVYGHLEVDYPVAMLRFCFIIIVALFNYTEATFFGVSSTWLLFLLGVMDGPSQGRTNIARRKGMSSVMTDRSENKLRESG